MNGFIAAAPAADVPAPVIGIEAVCGDVCCGMSVDPLAIGFFLKHKKKIPPRIAIPANPPMMPPAIAPGLLEPLLLPLSPICPAGLKVWDGKVDVVDAMCSIADVVTALGGVAGDDGVTGGVEGDGGLAGTLGC